jgi:hypothetical protein
MNETIYKFISEGRSRQWTPNNLPDNLWKSNWPWAPIKLDFDFDKVSAELKSLKYFFVPHRDKDKVNSYNHEGWSAVTLHGIDYDKTEHWDQYGFEEEPKYRWTEVSDYCPHIVEKIKQLPYESFSRVRIMKLSAGGYIMPHTDGPGRIFGPLNIALTNPAGCKFVFKNYGEVPFSPGMGFLLNIGEEHCVVNESTEDRYHIIIHGVVKPEIRELVVKTLATYEHS